MSHDHGRHKAARHKPARGPRGDEQAPLDRPSLFAPVDNSDDEQADMQRVHILSTLESARRPPRASPSKAHKQRQRENGPAGTWQIKLLMGLMVAGVVSLFAAFVLLVLDNGAQRDSSQAQAPTTAPRPAAGPQAARARAVPVDRNNPLAALVAQPAEPSQPLPPEQQAAIIENLPLDPTAPITAPATTPIKPDTLDAMPSVANAATPEPPATRPFLALTAPKRDHAMTNAGAPVTAGADPLTARAAEKAPVKRAPKSTKDDDVALVEAVLAHSATGKAQASPSVAEEFHQCAKLSAAAAATCRARICVQHPTQPACHQDP